MEVPANPGNVSLQEIYHQVEENESETKKTAWNQRRIHQEKSLSFTRRNIAELREWQSQLGKSALFGFICGLIGGLSQIAGMLAPGVGTVVAQAVGAITGTLQQLNPFASGMQKTQAKAQEYEQLAKLETGNEQRSQEGLETAKEHRRKLLNDLERIQDNNQKAQEATLKV